MDMAQKKEVKLMLEIVNIKEDQVKVIHEMEDTSLSGSQRTFEKAIDMVGLRTDTLGTHYGQSVN